MDGGLSLKDRVAVVTGGGRGIGRGIALEMARAGADVVVTGRRQGLLDEVSSSIRGLGRRTLTFAYDMDDIEASAAMVDEVVAKLGRIDILVNNASDTNTKVGCPAEETTPEDWDRAMNVNLRGLFFCSTAAARTMKLRGGGNIINIGSAGGLRAMPGLVPYSTSKGAVIHLTRVLAIEWAGYGIRVNCICPYYTRTERMADRLSDPAIYQAVISRIPLGRVGEPADIATAAVFLASPGADFITGHILPVDGGWEATM